MFLIIIFSGTGHYLWQGGLSNSVNHSYSKGAPPQQLQTKMLPHPSAAIHTYVC